MGSRRKMSDESSLASLSSPCLSSSSSYDDIISTLSDSELGKVRRHTRSPKALTLFDDVKIILSNHDRKLLKVEDDINFMVRWLNEKFGFIMKSGSTSSCVSVQEDDENEEYSASAEQDGEEDNADVFCDDDDDSDSFIVPGSNDLEKNTLKLLHAPAPESVAEEKLQEMPEKILQIQADINQGPRLVVNSENEIINNADVAPATLPFSYTASPATKQLRDIASSSKTTERVLPSQLPVRRVKQYRSSGIKVPGMNSPLLPSQCDICGKFLKDQNSLRQHKQIHQDIRPFVCHEPDCGKSFRRKFHLQTHSLIHKGVKKHQCGYCGRLFLLQKDLVSHERIHTGERPFKCKDCPKSFNLKSHLVMHVRTHTGEKPYECEICSKCFSQSNSLRLHKKKVHKDKTSVVHPKKSRSKKSTTTKKKQTKLITPQMNNPSVIFGASPIPGKLPLYRNQGTILSIPSTAPMVTILTQPHQPLIATQPIEIIEPIGINTNLTRGEQIILPISPSSIRSINFLPGEGIGSSSFVSSEIIDIS